MKSPFVHSALIAIAAWAAASAAYAAARATVSRGPIGYGRETTGGGGGPTCRVTDLATLRACVAGAAPRNVVVAGGPLTIEIDRPPVDVGSNKTIDGAGVLSIVFTRRGLRLKDSANVIVRGVRFRSTLKNTLPTDNCIHPAGPDQVRGCGVAISLEGATVNVWIDHNDFTQCGDKCITGWGQPESAGRVPAPDLISVSNNRFTDSYYAMLFGVSKRVGGARYPDHPIRITVYDNLFDRVLRRSPRLGAGFAHVFNNDIRRFGSRASCERGDFGFGPSVVEGGQMLLEDNVIEAWPGPTACKQAVKITTGKQVDGFVLARGNLTRNGAIARGEDRVFVPDYPYAPMDSRRVEAFVAANAGAGNSSTAAN